MVAAALELPQHTPRSVSQLQASPSPATSSSSSPSSAARGGGGGGGGGGEGGPSAPAVQVQMQVHVQPPAQAQSGFHRALAAGAMAGVAVDVILFPLDSLKTRLQAKDWHSGQLRRFGGLYRGLPVVMMGNSLGSAVFFATYEGSKAALGAPASRLESVMVDSASAVLGELVACTLRTPTEILKQRMQVLQAAGISDGVRGITVGNLWLGFRATALRDLGFSAIQYPAYEYLKSLASERRNNRPLSAWESAMCGSITGSCTAVLTTPLDVVKTRVMLNRAACARAGGVLAETSRIYKSEGLRAFFTGATYRGLWMGLGGLIFLGSYERAKALLKDESPPVKNFSGRYAWTSLKDERSGQLKAVGVHGECDFTYRRCWYAESSSSSKGHPIKRDPFADEPLDRTANAVAAFKQVQLLDDPFCESPRDAPSEAKEKASGEPPALSVAQGIAVEMLAGGIAGCAVDVLLYPLDTLKTRLQTTCGFQQAGGLRGLWRGVSAPALAGMPASAAFWAAYVPLKSELYSSLASNTQAEVIAGPVSELFSLVVRVPSEVLKQRMQAGIHTGRLLDLAVHIYGSEGWRGFYTGFAATCCRSVPFALVQFPVYEELKRQMNMRVARHNSWWVGGASGALAGGIAAIVTTPLDVIKTRIMLAPLEERRGYAQTARLVLTREGPSGFFSGVLPRGLNLTLGGMVYLGVYNVVAERLRDAALARA